MIIEKANICDICKYRITNVKCEICNADICNACCNSKNVSVKGVKIFEYAICKNCNQRFEGLKTEVIIKPETIKEIKNQINEQLQKAVCVNALKENGTAYY